MFPVVDHPPSNDGGMDITQKTLDFWKDGRDREEIKLQDLELNLSLSAFNKNGEYTIVLLLLFESSHRIRIKTPCFFKTTGGILSISSCRWLQAFKFD